MSSPRGTIGRTMTGITTETVATMTTGGGVITIGFNDGAFDRLCKRSVFCEQAICSSMDSGEWIESVHARYRPIVCMVYTVCMERTPVPHFALEMQPAPRKGEVHQQKPEWHTLDDIFESADCNSVTSVAQRIAETLAKLVDVSSLTCNTPEGAGPVLAEVQNRVTAYMVHNRRVGSYEELVNTVTRMFPATVAAKLRRSGVGCRGSDLNTQCGKMIREVFDDRRRAGTLAEASYILRRAKTLGILPDTHPSGVDTEAQTRILTNVRLDGERKIDVLEIRYVPGALEPRMASLRLVQIKSNECEPHVVEEIHKEHRECAAQLREYPLPVFDIETQRREDEVYREAQALAQSEFFALLELVETNADADNLLRDHMRAWPQDDNVAFYSELYKKLESRTGAVWVELRKCVDGVVKKLSKSTHRPSKPARHYVPVPIVRLESVVVHVGGEDVCDITPVPHEGADHGVLYEDRSGHF